MNKKTNTIAQIGLLAALCFVSFRFLKIDIPIPGTDSNTAIHFGNIFLVLAALLLGGLNGGLAGAIGMTIGDLLDPKYVLSAPKTFVLKLAIGLIVGLVAHKMKKINKSNDKKYIAKWALVASIVGMGFNVIADPLVGYFYKMYILGHPQEIASVITKIAGGVTAFNAVVTVIIANIIYMAVRPVLEKSGYLIKE